MMISGWASVLNTNSSSEIKSSSENIKYKYLKKVTSKLNNLAVYTKMLISKVASKIFWPKDALQKSPPKDFGIRIPCKSRLKTMLA